MFKWPGPPHEVEGALPLTLVHTGGMAARERPGKAFKTRRLFNGPTGYLRRLHGHLSVMDPGQGYAPHRDKHDVAIILFSGKLQANDEVIAPHTVVYHSGGSLHGLSNVGEEPARYLVFEFEHPEGQRDPRPGRKRKRERKSKGKTRGKERQAVPLTLMERLSREIRRPFRRLRLPKRIRRRLLPRRAGDSAQGTGQGGDA
jgi:quercetin dioxygenase-like cupin family protein